MEIRREKLLGMAGAIAQLAGSYINLAGSVVVYVAIKRLGDILGDRKSSQDYLLSLILSFSIPFVFIIWFVAGYFLLISPLCVKILSSPHFPSIFILPSFLLVWIVMIISGYFLRRSFFRLAELIRQEDFKRAGEYVFWGTILCIVLVGFILLLLGGIYEVLAFYSLPDFIEIKQREETAI